MIPKTSMRSTRYTSSLMTATIMLCFFGSGCSSALDKIKGSASASSAGDSDSKSPPPDPDGGDTASTPGSQPVPISGINLVDDANAALSCATVGGDANLFNVTCTVMIMAKDGTLVPAAGIAAGVTLNWASPAVTSGTLSGAGCTIPATDSLTFSCAIEATSALDTPSADFLFVVDKMGKRKTVSTTFKVLPEKANSGDGRPSPITNAGSHAQSPNPG